MFDGEKVTVSLEIPGEPGAVLIDGLLSSLKGAIQKIINKTVAKGDEVDVPRIAQE